MMMGLRPILSESQPKTMKNGVPITRDSAIMICAQIGIDLQRLGEEEQGVELPRVPDHGLARGQPEQGKDDEPADASSW